MPAIVRQLFGPLPQKCRFKIVLGFPGGWTHKGKDRRNIETHALWLLGTFDKYWVRRTRGQLGKAPGTCRAGSKGSRRLVGKWYSRAAT